MRASSVARFARHSQGCCNLRIVQALASQRKSAGGIGLQASRLPALINSVALGNGNSGGLPFPACLLLHFGNSEQNAGNHLPGGAGKVKLLRHADEPDTLTQPIAKRVNSIAQTTGKAVEFPDNDRLDLPSEDVGLQPDEFRPVKVVPRVPVHVVSSIGNPITDQPLVDFGTLPGLILSYGRNSDVDGDFMVVFPRSRVTPKVYATWRNSPVRNDILKYVFMTIYMV